MINSFNDEINVDLMKIWIYMYKYVTTCIIMYIYVQCISLEFESDSCITEISTHLERMADLLFQEEEEEKAVTMVIAQLIK